MQVWITYLSSKMNNNGQIIKYELVKMETYVKKLSD